MTVQNRKKLNLLEHELPEGLLVDAAWLEQRGFSRSLRSHYVAAGWLEQPARSVYRRPRGSLSWEQVVISLQAMLDVPVSVGGRSALELQGYAHYLPQSQPVIHLYSDVKLPAWVSKLAIGQGFAFHNRTRFLPKVELSAKHPALSHQESGESSSLPGALRVTHWGQWQWPLIMSAAERAILELLDELPNHETFHHVDMLMEGLVNLRPLRMQTLLEQTSNIKVKRLFFFFADRHNHRWLHHIAREKIDLGEGKRVLVKGGKLDPKYQITVPERMDGIQ